MPERADIAIVGAGAAGLFAAIWAGRTASAAGRRLRIVALDGARRLGAKILIAGGGRCNITHDTVDESAYAGSSPPAIRNILCRFGVEQTVEFFRRLGVEVKREETGKLFPTSDDARTVLDALLRAAAEAGVELRYPWRVREVRPASDGFEIVPEPGGAGGAGGGVGDPLLAARVILCTGGRSLPKTGSDGHGYAIARSLGHTITPRVFPGLVPLTLPREHFICGLSGLTVPATVVLRAGSGKRLISFTDSTLCTHFGLSGPGVLDISRYWTNARLAAAESGQPPPILAINWLPGLSPEALEAQLIAAGQGRGPASVARLLRERLPERLVLALCAAAGIDPAGPVAQLGRDARRTLVRTLTELPLPITGDRGYTHAEVTAGGIPLREIDLKSMQSRAAPGLYLAGEICDVDGRIGGYNFQWAWASGYVAGCAAAMDAAATG
jgi:predicted Rossmann fold flavoprotein